MGRRSRSSSRPDPRRLLAMFRTGRTSWESPSAMFGECPSIPRTLPASTTSSGGRSLSTSTRRASGWRRSSIPKYRLFPLAEEYQSEILLTRNTAFDGLATESASGRIAVGEQLGSGRAGRTGGAPTPVGGESSRGRSRHGLSPRRSPTGHRLARRHHRPVVARRKSWGRRFFEATKARLGVSPTTRAETGWSALVLTTGFGSGRPREARLQVWDAR